MWFHWHSSSRQFSFQCLVDKGRNTCTNFDPGPENFNRVHSGFYMILNILLYSCFKVFAIYVSFMCKDVLRLNALLISSSCSFCISSRCSLSDLFAWIGLVGEYWSLEMHFFLDFCFETGSLPICGNCWFANCYYGNYNGTCCHFLSI